MPKARRSLPPLEVDTVYQAADFRTFEFAREALTGSIANLRLHLKNKTIIELPTNDEELKSLLLSLCSAFPTTAIDHLEKRGWVTRTTPAA
jgi:hypothetical protein